MLSEEIRKAIYKHTGTSDPVHEPLHGGDINEVFLVHGRSCRVVVKTNEGAFPGMFQAEASGLAILSAARAFSIPKVYEASEAFIMLEYIPSGRKQQVSGEVFGSTLARLHAVRQDHFGLQENNYIGSLPQRNNLHARGIDFYREERLLPQFEMAMNSGFRFNKLDVFLQKLEELIPEEKPSLIHGDLWSGNYMVSQAGDPCLIDPAVSFSHREMDLAMMALFGGFPRNYLESYQEALPLMPGWKERISLWQLYYILVHLNIFGAGYYSRCMQIIRQYT